MPPRHARPVALVTGAGKRVGAVIARTLHAAGYDLVMHCRHSVAEASELAAQLAATREGSTLVLQAELAEPTTPGELVAAALARYGRLDALVNNASAYYATPLGAITPAQWDELLGTNARVPFFLCQAAADALRAARGTVVNIADIYAERPLRGYPVYSISKAALVMVTKVLALELGPEVRVNAVAPGNMLWSTNPVKAETAQTVHERTALGRQGSPQDVADAVLYLLRDAHYTSGIVLPTDGGRLLHI